MYPEADWRDDRDGDLRPDAEAADIKDQEWTELEEHCLWFAAKYGWPALLRIVSYAMAGKDQEK